METVFLNGKMVPRAEAKISVFDRGFLFADGVYEVIPVFNGKAFLAQEHIDRLYKSLQEVKIVCDNYNFLEITENLIDKNSQKNQFIYIQVSRGYEANRNHVYSQDTEPTVFAYSQEFSSPSKETLSAGYKAIVREDIRWKKCSIKSISLLPNILLKAEADQLGCIEAILHRDGFVTEATAANVFVVKDGKIKTPTNSHLILPGITKDFIIKSLREEGVEVEEAPVSLEELQSADEVWVTSSTKNVYPLVEVEGRHLGAVGNIWHRCYEILEKKLPAPQ